MTAFIFIAVAMVAAALCWVLWPLLRSGPTRSVEHAAANVSIFKEQFADLDADLTRGTLSHEHHIEAKSELERRLLDEVRATSSVRPEHRSHRWAAVAVALILPIAAATLYWQFGTPRALSGGAIAAADDGSLTREQIEMMITDLTRRLEKEPDNAEARSLLARTHYAIGNFSQAADAYARLSVVFPDDADLMADYADALAMSDGRSFAGKPMELVTRALKLDPSQWKALAMAGSEAFERRDYKAAMEYWQRLQTVVPPESPVAKQVQGSIDQARELAATASGAPLAARPNMGAVDRSPGEQRSVSGTVALSPSLMSKVRPDDAVFIFARPVDGSRMPVAVVRARVGELPLKFTLDDSRAMGPSVKISNLAEVLVTARVSRTGNAIPASGDLEAAAEKVKVGSRDIAITIDRAVP
ncbi:MAG: c-type cytochrome biogenesis protein CcmI [Burkholderiaceae bacterium]